jgi:hypothetical protein
LGLEAWGKLWSRSSVLSHVRLANTPERGARMARRDDRAYWAYVREEQRRQPGCPARRIGKSYVGQDTSFRAVCDGPTCSDLVHLRRACSPRQSQQPGLEPEA